LATSISWDPAGAASAPIPWAQVEATLRLCQRWPNPHLLFQREAELPRRAAVAVLLWGDAQGAREVILVQRGAGAPQHAGELAFPGGMEEPCDRDLPATARRELEEELGVGGDEVARLGLSTSWGSEVPGYPRAPAPLDGEHRERSEQAVPPSRSGLWEMGCFPDAVAKARTRFTPVFLRWEAPVPEFRLSSEIQAVLRLPLEGLLRAPWTSQVLEIKGGTAVVPRLELPLAPLWGATARILKSWLDLLEAVRKA